MIWDEKDQKLLDYVRAMKAPLSDFFDLAEDELKRAPVRLVETTPLTQHLASSKPAEGNSPMDLHEQLRQQQADTKDANDLLTVDPNAEKVLRDHEGEVAHEAYMARQKAKPTPRQIEEADAALSGGSRESDNDFDRRLAEQKRRQRPLEFMTEAEVKAVNETLTLEQPAGVLS